MVQALAKADAQRTLGAIALLAWCMLLWQTIAHADDLDHSDSASPHCVMCTSAGPEDEFVPLQGGITVSSPSSHSINVQADVDQPIQSRGFRRTPARAPPAH